MVRIFQDTAKMDNWIPVCDPIFQLGSEELMKINSISQFNIVTDREFKGRSYLQTTASVFPIFLYTNMQFIQHYYDEGMAMVTKLMVAKNVKETYTSIW